MKRAKVVIVVAIQMMHVLIDAGNASAIELQNSVKDLYGRF